MKRLFSVCLVCLLAPAIQPLRAGTVTVFAAASLTDALKEAGAAYEKQSSDKVVFSFAGSGTLMRQIEAGAPADIFISADEARADELEKKGLLVSGTRTSRLGNSLVIVTPPAQSAVHVPADLTNAAVKRVAIGEVKTVPAGTYAKAYLDQLGLWPAIEAKAVPCENVRAVLAAVESGNVDAGIVYKTDAAVSKEVKVAFEVPAGNGLKITYPMALVKGGPEPEAARRFLNFLRSEDAAQIFRNAGFIVPQRLPRPRGGLRAKSPLRSAAVTPSLPSLVLNSNEPA